MQLPIKAHQNNEERKSSQKKGAYCSLLNKYCRKVNDGIFKRSPQQKL